MLFFFFFSFYSLREAIFLFDFFERKRDTDVLSHRACRGKADVNAGNIVGFTGRDHTERKQSVLFHGLLFLHDFHLVGFIPRDFLTQQTLLFYTVFSFFTSCFLRKGMKGIFILILLCFLFFFYFLRLLYFLSLSRVWFALVAVFLLSFFRVVNRGRFTGFFMWLSIYY